MYIYMCVCVCVCVCVQFITKYEVFPKELTSV